MCTRAWVRWFDMRWWNPGQYQGRCQYVGKRHAQARAVLPSPRVQMRVKAPKARAKGKTRGETEGQMLDVSEREVHDRRSETRTGTLVTDMSVIPRIQRLHARNETHLRNGRERWVA